MIFASGRPLWGSLGGFWGPLGSSLGRLEVILERLRAILGPLGVILGRLEPSWSPSARKPRVFTWFWGHSARKPRVFACFWGGQGGREHGPGVVKRTLPGVPPSRVYNKLNKFLLT